MKVRKLGQQLLNSHTLLVIPSRDYCKALMLTALSAVGLAVIFFYSTVNNVLVGVVLTAAFVMIYFDLSTVSTFY